MNVPVVLVGIAVMVALRFVKPNTLTWLAAWWVVVYAAVRFGVVPPLPSSIVNMFMAIVTAGLLTYLFADSERLENTKRLLVKFLVDRQYSKLLMVVVLVLPLAVALKVYVGLSQGVRPPTIARTIHPAPPETIRFGDKEIDLVGGVNPYRQLEDSDPNRFAEHVENGGRVYYQNCVFCHGDDMEGQGIFAHALDPIPANFAEPTTIAMLQETYLFWRIAEGAPGLPSESTPWSSAMPAWEQFLTEEEIWDVILFLYDHTGQRPRATEHVE
ncbi:MAG: cytochrome c [Candidatus Krumholzibacteria bacterium]